MTNKQIINQIIKDAQVETIIMQSINGGENEYDEIHKYVKKVMTKASIVDVSKAVGRLQEANFIERIGKFNMKSHDKFIKAWIQNPIKCKVKRPLSKFRITKLFLTIQK